MFSLNVPKCKFSLKNNSLKCWLCFRLLFLSRISGDEPIKATN